MNDKQIAQVILTCSQFWPNWRHPESLAAMVEGWRILLADVDYDAALAAVADHASNGSEFPPPVGVIRLRAAQLAMPAGRAPSVDEAWQNVLTEISRVGLSTEYDTDRELRFVHPAVESVVRAMGWKELCLSQNQIADRAHFSRMYTERVTRDVQEAAMPPIVKQLVASHAPAIEAGEPVKLGDLLPLKPVQR